MHSKSLSSVEIKDAAQGRVEAVFSTFGVIDHDGDITDPSAFEHGAKVLISSYNHKSWEGALPVGKGRIEVTPMGAILKGQFFMNTQQGRDTFETVKALAEDGQGEWSYGFTVDDSEQVEVEGKSVRKIKKLSVFEVSPVLKGAGVGTQTLSVKDARRGYDEKPPKRRGKDDDEEEESQTEDSSASEDDEDDDKPRKKPKPKGIETPSLKEEIDQAVDAAKSAIASAERVAALRAEAEKQLSHVNRESLDGLRDALAKLDELLTVETKAATTDAEKEFIRFVAFNVKED